MDVDPSLPLAIAIRSLCEIAWHAGRSPGEMTLKQIAKDTLQRIRQDPNAAAAIAIIWAPELDDAASAAQAS